MPDIPAKRVPSRGPAETCVSARQASCQRVLELGKPGLTRLLRLTAGRALDPAADRVGYVRSGGRQRAVAQRPEPVQRLALELAAALLADAEARADLGVCRGLLAP